MCEWSKFGNTRIDPCMRRIVSYLCSCGVRTLSCCCGHNIYASTIVVQYSNGEPFEIFSGTFIPRNKRFYKRDNRGHYYIPEVVGK